MSKIFCNYRKLFRNRSQRTVKLGLYIVVRVAEHACDDASKRILKLSTYRLQIFLGKDPYLSSLQQYGDQVIARQLEKHVLKPMLAILTTYMETTLKSLIVNKRLEHTEMASLLSWMLGEGNFSEKT